MVKIKSLLVSLIAVIGLMMSGIIGVSAVGNSKPDLWTDYATGSFSSGSGTREDPYRIGSAEELALLAKLTNMEDKNYNSANYVLTSDIDLSAHCWVPIGSITGNGSSLVSDAGFFGVLDATGHTITNMKILSDYEDVYQYGLFGMNMGTIKNLILKNPVICFDSSQSGWQASNGMGTEFDIGGLVGYCKGNISNCTIEDVNIDVTSAMSLTCGGLAGGVKGSTIRNSKVTGTVSAKAGRAVEAGGFIGNVGGGVRVSCCSFNGTVKSENSGFIGSEELENQGFSYLHYAGGFCGSAGRAVSNIDISNCYAVGTLTSKSEKGRQCVGGFAGAIGVIYGKASYRNLLCKVDVTVDRAGTVKKEENFWQGEMANSFQEYADEWVYTNSVRVFGDTYWTQSYHPEENSIKGYAFRLQPNKRLEGFVEMTPGSNIMIKISINHKEYFKDQLKFDEAYWTFREDDLPILKIDGEHDHYYTASVTREPTCQQSGITTYSCVCGESYTEEIEKKAHIFGEWEWLTKPTYTSEGCMAATCTMCGIGTDTKFIPPLETTAVSSLTVSNISSQVYTGKAVTPTVTVKDGKKTLTAGTHYTVTYKNNTKIGTASITICGVKENGYSGSKTLSFTILPGVTSSTATATNSTVIKLAWKTVPGATGYRVYQYDAKTKKYTTLKTTTSTSYTVVKLRSGTSYKFAVRAYTTVNGETYWSAGYKTVTATALPGVTSSIATATNSTVIKLAWKAVPGATGYRVFQYDAKTKKYVTLKTTTGTSYTVTKLKSGTSYKFAVRAYTTVNGKVYWASGYK
ncbi:MAG: fibronectin type III domain-containing protein, partial [Oscillospiraceae bacterium]|nr:fibronectin type III domain-containing protein [Oscillospiraceae bacterium]